MLMVIAVGGIIGFALVWDGTNAVIWAEKDTKSFPPYKGVVAIILSWFVSPVLSGLTAALIFFVVRTLVLRQKNAYMLSFWTLPPFVLVTTFINLYFVFTKVLCCDCRLASDDRSPNTRCHSYKTDLEPRPDLVKVILCRVPRKRSPKTTTGLTPRLRGSRPLSPRERHYSVYSLPCPC